MAEKRDEIKAAFMTLPSAGMLLMKDNHVTNMMTILSMTMMMRGMRSGRWGVESIRWRGTRLAVMGSTLSIPY